MAFSFKLTDNTSEVKRAKDMAVERALEAIGLQCENYATLMCPVATGNLSRSITHEVHMNKESVYVGTRVKYAPYVEFGHLQEVGRYVPAIGKRLVKPMVDAKPYLRPAVNDHIAEYKRMAEMYLKNG